MTSPSILSPDVNHVLLRMGLKPRPNIKLKSAGRNEKTKVKNTKQQLLQKNISFHSVTMLVFFISSFKFTIHIFTIFNVSFNFFTFTFEFKTFLNFSFLFFLNLQFLFSNVQSRFSFHMYFLTVFFPCIC